jgi:hypothetical protein
MKEQTVVGFVLPVHQPRDGPSPDSGDPTVTRRSLPLSALRTESYTKVTKEQKKHDTEPTDISLEGLPLLLKI